MAPARVKPVASGLESARPHRTFYRNVPQHRSLPMRALAFTAVLAAAAVPALAQEFSWGPRNTSLAPAVPDQFRAPLDPSGIDLALDTVADGLTNPWGIEILPDGAGYLVTERSGSLRHIARDGTVSAPIGGLPPVVALRQGGLLDIALAPDFAASRRIFWTYAKPMGRSDTATAAATGLLSADLAQVTDVRDIFVQQPAVPAPMHFGSRIAFDGAGHVFITTGEHSFRQYAVLAQDNGTTFGKVVRLHLDGSVPADNPMVDTAGALPEIWTSGHRNIQGATYWDGRLWTIEHGPRGGDELNLHVPGANYGWPVVSYGENYNGSPVGQGRSSDPAFVEPVYFWDPVIAPSGMQPYDGALFPDWRGDLLIASLNPGGVVRLEIENARVVAEERVLHGFDRVRDIEVDTDGSILILTDRADGRLIRLTPG